MLLHIEKKMKALKITMMIAALTLSLQCKAEDPEARMHHKRTVSGNDVLIDMALRPAGFLATITGAALYVGLSPFTAFSHAFPPHDSFQKLGKVLVVTPAKFTFSRPVGDYTHESMY